MRLHIVTNNQTLAYYHYCVENHLKLAKNPENIEVFAYCLDSYSYTGLVRENKNAIRLPDNSGSVGHALGIQAFLSNLKQDHINIISDSDCVVLCKNWDEKIKNILENKGIAGTTYEDIGGFSSGNSTVQTYKNIPNFTWAALSPEYNWNFDAMCQKQENLQITTVEQSQTFNLPIGYSLLREGNWKLPVHLKENRIPYYSFKFVRPSSQEAKAVLSGEDYHTEYQLQDGTPFVAHQRGSMSKAFRHHHLSKTFYDACELYLAKEGQ